MPDRSVAANKWSNAREMVNHLMAAFVRFFSCLSISGFAVWPDAVWSRQHRPRRRRVRGKGKNQNSKTVNQKSINPNSGNETADFADNADAEQVGEGLGHPEGSYAPFSNSIKLRDIRVIRDAYSRGLRACPRRFTAGVFGLWTKR